MEIIARGQITIWNYKDGDDAYSVILNHDTHAVACDPSGNALGGELGPSGKAVFALSAYRGATKLTMRYSSAASTAGMCAWKFGTISGCTAAQMSGSNEKFYINTMTADSAYVEIVCSVDGKASITKRVTVVKQKKGDTGDPGKPGDDGKQGCMIRPRGTWTAQTQYVYNDQYRDVVIHNNSVYIVKTTHTSTVSFDSSKWEPFNEFINVATSVLLANKGYIDVLGAARLFVGDTNKSTGWEMTNGYIKHTKSGLTLTADGKLYDPDGLHLSVGGKTVQAIVDGAVDGIQVGGRNILLNSGDTITPNATDYRIHVYDSAVKFKAGEKYTVVIKGSTSVGQSFGLWINGGTSNAGHFPDNMKGTVEYKHITMPSSIGSPSVSTLNLYNYPNPNGASKPCEVEWVAMYEGHIKPPMDWTPATEDLTKKIEENSSKIEQLPDQISLTVKKDISSGGLNYITNSTKILETVGKGIANQVVGVGWKINKSISGKKYGGAFKVKFEGCSFSSNSTIYLQVGNSGGWNYQGITGYNKVQENGEYVFFRNTNTAPETTDDGGVYIRIDYISGGKITVSEVRAYDAVEGLTEAFPWYPSKWDSELMQTAINQNSDSISLKASQTEVDNLTGRVTIAESEIKQTAESISLKVDKLQGGTNLLPHSKLTENVNGWNVNGLPNYGITTQMGASCLYLSGSTSGVGIWQNGYMPPQYKTKGNMFAVSFDIYNPNNADKLRIGLEGALTSELSVNIKDQGTSGWTRIAKTMTYDNIKTDSFVIYTDYDNYPTVYIKHVKIEFGPYASNFTENEKDVLLATGIDIFDRKLIFTADNTLIQDNSGNKIAMFTTTPEGKTLLAATNIDVDNLKVKHLEGAVGTFGGELIAATGSFANVTAENMTAQGSFMTRSVGSRVLLDSSSNAMRLVDSNDIVRGQFESSNGEASLKLNSSRDYSTALYADSLRISKGISNYISITPDKISFNGADGYTGVVNIKDGLDQFDNEKYIQLYIKGGIIYNVKNN